MTWSQRVQMVLGVGLAGVLLGASVAAPAQAAPKPHKDCRVSVSYSKSVPVLTILDHRMSGHLRAAFKGRTATLTSYSEKPFTLRNVAIPYRASQLPGRVMYVQGWINGVPCKAFSVGGI
jgi:hypothetical protein